jgi:Flp pilus assembly secretin CpaC
MTAMCVAGRTAKSALYRLAAVALFAGFAVQSTLPAAAQPPNSEPLYAPLDEATLFKLPDRTASVVIGNPLIADITVQAGNVAVITPKGNGGTNVVALDSAGTVLMEKDVIVGPPSDHVVYMYRGAARVTYSCHPDCSPRVNLGDDPEAFEKILEETVSRTTQAMTAGASATAPR